MSSLPTSDPQSDRRTAEEARALDQLSRHRAKPVRPPGRKLGVSIGKLLGKASKNEGPGLSLIQQRWPELVGERLAKLSRPVRLTGKGPMRVLTLDINPSASTVFQHQSEFLRQHIGQAIGGTLKDIKLIQKNPGTSSQTSARRIRPLTALEREALQDGVSNIKNPKLAAALLAFGEAIYTDDR